jgi:hypothetical protein
MGIRVVKILNPQGHIVFPLPLDLTQEGRVSIGAIIEKRALVERQDTRVVSRFVTDEEPRIKAQFEKSLKNCHRYPLSAPSFIRSIDDHNFAKLRHYRSLKVFNMLMEWLIMGFRVVRWFFGYDG